MLPTWALNIRGILDIGTPSAAHAVAKLPVWSSFSASSRVGCAPIAPGLVVVTAPQAAANSTHLRSLSASPRTASRPPACKRTQEESKICMLCRLPLRFCCASPMLLPRVLCQKFHQVVLMQNIIIPPPDSISTLQARCLPSYAGSGDNCPHLY